MDSFKAFFNKAWLQYLLFWVGVFLFWIFSNSQATQMTNLQAAEIYGTIVFCQFIAAAFCLKILIPRLLNKGKTVLFVACLFVLTLALFIFYIHMRIGYLEPKYFQYYNKVMPDYIKLNFWERLFEFRVFLSKAINYLSPTALLLLIRYYRNQQKFLAMNEQKKTAELSALKNQLNPHFLFNTLNNLYTLALQKSEKTPEVISVLSDILDYMLYRCNEKYVSLDKEIELIENYILLEKLRYGKRANVTFTKSAGEGAIIAPLILLTFIENAFKHGVSQELNEAKLSISLTSVASKILFTITNTIPNSGPLPENQKESIGLDNVKKQLELLYPESHELTIDHSEEFYSVKLKLDNP